jgi:hypothetical protein
MHAGRVPCVRISWPALLAGGGAAPANVRGALSMLHYWGSLACFEHCIKGLGVPVTSRKFP